CSTTVTNTVPPPPTTPECTPSKTASPTGSVPIGTVITYTVSVKNTGGATGNCSIVDALTTDSSSTTFDLVQSPVAPSGTTLTLTTGTNAVTIHWSVPGLAAGASDSFTMQIKVTGAGTIFNSTTGTGNASGLISNSATSTTNCTMDCVVIVNNPVVYQLTKTVSPTGTVPVGTTLTYTIALANTSQNAATSSVL